MINLWNHNIQNCYFESLDAPSLYYPIKICKCPTVFELMLKGANKIKSPALYIRKRKILKAKLVKQLIAKINQKPVCLYLIKFHKQ